MSTLITDNNFYDPDEFYETLISTHSDLTPEQSEALNARLVLLMANHIGDLSVVSQAINLARSSIVTIEITERT
jgi:DUF1009 family protein